MNEMFLIISAFLCYNGSCVQQKENHAEYHYPVTPWEKIEEKTIYNISTKAIFNEKEIHIRYQRIPH